MKKIQIFGDSIMKGVVYNEEMNKYSLCKDKLAVENAEITNRSKMGATIEYGMTSAIRHLHEYGSSSTVLLEFGGNDCNHKWDEVSEHPELEHISFVPPRTFVEDYIKTINILKKAGAQVIVSTLPPISSEKFMNYLSRGLNFDNILQWLGSVEILSRRQQEYSELAKRVAERTGCKILPLREAAESLPGWEDMLCADGMHPSEAGYEYLHAFMADALAGA